MKFKTVAAFCLLWLAPLSLAAPTPNSENTPDHKFPIDHYLKNIMPFQLQRFNEFRNQFREIVTPEQDKLLEKLGNMFKSGNFKDLESLVAEGESIFPSEQMQKNHR
ncbi:hypothetical protein LOZ66_006283 [Ophidiomyces ophidiicola]|nr:hypothetical protein LOZ66_006283 [Ophidiomyces ophidiicola]